jgi:hypothetical protein
MVLLCSVYDQFRPTTAAAFVEKLNAQIEYVAENTKCPGCGERMKAIEHEPGRWRFECQRCAPWSRCGGGSCLGRWPKPLKELKLATFNVRAETVDEKPMFRSAFKRKRCLIPVSGYYEWQDTPGGKQPWYFTTRDGSPALTIAALWDESTDKETLKRLKSCTMIITEPNKFVAEVHDRMPVLLTEKQFDPWLSGEAGVEYLEPAPNDFLQKWPVSKG